MREKGNGGYEAGEEVEDEGGREEWRRKNEEKRKSEREFTSRATRNDMRVIWCHDFKKVGLT